MAALGASLLPPPPLSILQERHGARPPPPGAVIRINLEPGKHRRYEPGATPEILRGELNVQLP